MMNNIDDDWRTHSIFGTSGWGKTRYAKTFIAAQLDFMSEHTPDKSGVVIFDIEGDYLKMFNNPADKKRRDILYPYRKLFMFIEIDKSTLSLDWYKLLSAHRFIIFAPNRSDKAIQAGQVLSKEEWVKVTTKIIEKVLLVKNRLLVIEEAHNLGTPHSLPWSLEEAIKQGRHREECPDCYSVRVMAITQRANKLNVEYRSQSTFFTSFFQDEDIDIEFLRGRFKKHADKLPYLKKGESIQYRRNDGAIVKMDTGYNVVETWGRE